MVKSDRKESRGINQKLSQLIEEIKNLYKNYQTKKEEIITARGYEAIVLQHEIDHLNGILYYDHIDKKNPFNQKEDAIRL